MQRPAGRRDGLGRGAVLQNRNVERLYLNALGQGDTFQRNSGGGAKNGNETD